MGHDPYLRLLRPVGKKQYLTLAEFKPYMWWRAPLKLAAGAQPGEPIWPQHCPNHIVCPIHIFSIMLSIRPPGMEVPF